MFHEIIIVGHLGRDPEMRYTPEGEPVTSFSVATQSGFGEHKKTLWFRISAWGKQAESCNQYLKKGAKALVIGRLNADERGGPRIWTDRDGLARASFEVTASTVRFLSSKSESDGVDETINGDDIDASDEIPF